MKENVVSLRDDREDTPERVHLKRILAAQHAESEFHTRDPSIWQWAKAYDYVEEQFGQEATETLRYLANIGRNPEPRAADKKLAPIGRKPHRHKAARRAHGPVAAKPIVDAVNAWIDSRAACAPLSPANDDAERAQ